MQLIPLSMLYGQSAIGTRISGSGALACHVSRRPFDGSHDDLRTYMKLSVCTVTHTHTLAGPFRNHPSMHERALNAFCTR